MSFELRVGRDVRFIPHKIDDILIGTGLLVLGDLAILYGDDSSLQILFGLLLLLLLPGYALLLALFPRRQLTESVRFSSNIRTAFSGRGRGINLRERAALSFGSSIVLIPPIALVLSGLGVGLTFYTILASVNVLVVLGFVVGERRRQKLEEAERFILPVRQWVGEARASVFGAETWGIGLMNALVIVTVVVAMSGVTYAIFVPNNGETYTDFSLVVEDETGNLVSSGYPSTLTAGESEELIVGIDNYERERTTYTVVVELQRVRTDDGSVVILERERVDEFGKELAPGQSWRKSHTITPTIVGEDLRLVYFLYTDDVPVKPSTDSAYRTLYLWVTVEDYEP